MLPQKWRDAPLKKVPVDTSVIPVSDKKGCGHKGTPTISDGSARYINRKPSKERHTAACSV
ncbi:MAG: hypothetical protein R2795_00710 [Saprospiraceae bacterium]